MVPIYELFGANPIIEALMLDPDRSSPLRSVRASKPLLREPFVETTHLDGAMGLHRFAREEFATSWAEARLLLSLLTDIRLQSDFNPGMLDREEQRRQEIVRIRDQCIADALALFEQGRYAECIDCYGPDSGNLPPAAAHILVEAHRLGGMEYRTPGVGAAHETV